MLLNGGTKTYEISGKGANNKYTIFINDQNVQEGKIDFTQTPAKVSDVKNSSYDDKVALPNVVGKDVSEAKKTLETSGFTNVKVVDEMCIRDRLRVCLRAAAEKYLRLRKLNWSLNPQRPITDEYE